jgi:trimethylamine---corrinoid protein Co-methyltransferase
MKLNRMQVLSEQEVQNIRNATTRILEETGIKIDSEKALSLLKDRGAAVDMEEGIVRFPAALQEKCLSSAPTTIDVFSREGEAAFALGDGNSYFASGHNAVFFEDPAKEIYRQFTLQDVEDYARLTHHLDDLDVLGLPASPSGVNSRTSLLYALKICMENSTKPVFFSTDSDMINHFAMDMAEVFTGKTTGKNTYMISQLSPTSPLFWEQGAVEGTIECAQRNFPVAILPEPIAGMTAPYSLAGLITVHNAEAISGVLITQLVNPGTPVIWSSSWTTFDMKKSATLVGSLETSLARIGGAQVAKSYGLPLHTTAPNSDNFSHDEQNSWEKVISTLCGAAAGNELIVNCGMYACGMTISLEQLIMDAEIVGQVKRLMNGIDASTEMIAEDLVKKVKHRGTFIMEDHTLDRLHSGEFREPLVGARGGRDLWIDEGGRDAVAAAREIADELKEKPVPTASAEISASLEGVIASYHK